MPRPAGTRWPYGLNSVSCTAVGTCEAVGSLETTWNNRNPPPLAARD